jgi:hypothetical protein
MVGKCIRKSDDKVFKYRLVEKNSLTEFHVLDKTWRFVGDQYAFELEYEFQNAIGVSIIFHDLVYGIGLLGGMDYLKLLAKVNGDKNVREETIVKWLCNGEPKMIQVFCTNDISVIDNNTSANETINLFIRGIEYQGVYFDDSHYMIIGENIASKGKIDCYVNGNVIEIFPEHGDKSEIFESWFFLFQTNDEKEKKEIWKEYEKKCVQEQFDL